MNTGAGRLVEETDREKVLELADTGHMALFDYWRSKLRGGRLPSRADIDPAEIPRDVLPSIYLVTVEQDEKRAEPRYAFRLVGTRIVSTSGRDITGLTVEEAYPRPDDLANQRGAYGRVVRSGAPYTDRYPMRIPGKEHILESRLLLPLASDGATVDMILGMSVYGPRSAPL